MRIGELARDRIEKSAVDWSPANTWGGLNTLAFAILSGTAMPGRIGIRLEPVCYSAFGGAAQAIQYREMPSSPDFTLIGFSQQGSVRHFAFQCRNDDWSHSDFTVDADTNLIRRYGISLQELPLLCRRLLEETLPVTPGCALIFGEEKMQRHADQREARERIAQVKNRPPRKPNSDNLGQAWRGPSF